MQSANKHFSGNYASQSYTELRNVIAWFFRNETNLANFILILITQYVIVRKDAKCDMSNPKIARGQPNWFVSFRPSKIYWVYFYLHEPYKRWAKNFSFYIYCFLSKP